MNNIERAQTSVISDRLSPVQTVMIVDDSFNYHQLSCSLDMFKFVMIVDDSFCRLNERIIVHDRFSASGFALNGLKPKMAISVLPAATSALIKFAKTVAITAHLG